MKYPPLFYSIEATNVCNYRCTYCPQGNPNTQGFKKGQMSTVLFETIVKQIVQLRPVSQVYLTGNGEPLMHPALEELISISNKYGFIPSFSSNGALFSGERIKSLLDSGKFCLTVDFSPSKEIYQTYRSGGDWNIVHTNLRNLLASKKKPNRDYPRIEIRDMSTIAISSQKEREKSFVDLKRLFKDFPVDRFSQLKLHRWTGNIDQKTIKSGVKGKKYRLCTHPWSLFVITWNGEVLPCCRDFVSEYVIGKIDGQDGIPDIWNGERITALREALVAKRPEEINICKNCDRPWTGGSVAGSKPQMLKKILWEKVAGTS